MKTVVKRYSFLIFVYSYHTGVYKEIGNYEGEAKVSLKKKKKKRNLLVDILKEQRKRFISIT